MKITRIRIPAEYRTDDTRTHTAVADFKLGVGPCGKEVTALDIPEPRADFPAITVVQKHSDGTAKTFSYFHKDLTGRVEVTYGP